LARAKNNRLKFFENTTNKTIDLAIAMTEAIGAGDWRLWYLYRDQLENLTVDEPSKCSEKILQKF
jgi:zinc protease